jgi:hypothetical protein
MKTVAMLAPNRTNNSSSMRSTNLGTTFQPRVEIGTGTMKPLQDAMEIVCIVGTTEL